MQIQETNQTEADAIATKKSAKIKELQLMEKVMVVVFESEKKAHDGIRALRKLDDEGSITVHTGALISKDESGLITIPENGLDDFPIQTLAGTAIGGLIGLLAGPAGYAAGAATGALAGMFGDLTAATLDEDFLNDVSGQLKPGTSAVVLDLEEDWITPIDADLAPFSKAIIRRPKVDVEDELTQRRIDANDREMEALEQEWEQAGEDSRKKIHARMEEIKQRNKNQAERLKKRRDRIRKDSKTKLDTLQQKASKGNAEFKQKAESRLDELKREDQASLGRIEESLEALRKADLDFTERVESSISSGLRKAADHFARKKTG